MKLVALLFSVAVLAVAIANPGCSVNHRSGDFACSPEVPCSSDRTCIDGYCVVRQADGGVIDPKVDASVCPAQCTSCSLGDKTCTIDCAVPGSACSGPITCPAGWSCNVACTTDNSCRNGIDCSNSTSCNITCSGTQSCRDVACGAGACKVDCTGDESCRGAVDCGASCACDVKCDLFAACDNVSCPRQLCDTGNGCSSQQPLCNTCP